jgi:hypothetical protein
MYLILRLGLRSATIEPDYQAMLAGAATRGSEWGNPAQAFGEQDDDASTLKLMAEDAFWLRNAVTCYAGCEAIRRLRPTSNPMDGADSDYAAAVDAINNITDDFESSDLYFQLASRRCVLLVDHYAPEIEAVASALLVRPTLSGEDTCAGYLEIRYAPAGRRFGHGDLGSKVIPPYGASCVSICTARGSF